MARSGQAEGIAGYATFHGGLATPEGQSYPADMPTLLVAHGGADSSVTMDHVAALSRELEAAGLDYQIEVYSGAPHAFTIRSEKHKSELQSLMRISYDVFCLKKKKKINNQRHANTTERRNNNNNSN